MFVHQRRRIHQITVADFLSSITGCENFLYTAPITSNKLLSFIRKYLVLFHQWHTEDFTQAPSGSIHPNILFTLLIFKVGYFGLSEGLLPNPLIVAKNLRTRFGPLVESSCTNSPHDYTYQCIVVDFRS
jgi:hypothetical protein